MKFHKTFGLLFLGAMSSAMATTQVSLVRDMLQLSGGDCVNEGISDESMVSYNIVDAANQYMNIVGNADTEYISPYSRSALMFRIPSSTHTLAKANLRLFVTKRSGAPTLTVESSSDTSWFSNPTSGCRFPNVNESKTLLTGANVTGLNAQNFELD